MNVCKFCFNAHVWASLPKTEEDYYDTGLDDSNDFRSATIGYSDTDFQMYLNTGNGKPTNIEVCTWIKDRWVTVAEYYPKYCPECGRELIEHRTKEEEELKPY